MFRNGSAEIRKFESSKVRKFSLANFRDFSLVSRPTQTKQPAKGEGDNDDDDGNDDKDKERTKYVGDKSDPRLTQALTQASNASIHLV